MNKILLILGSFGVGVLFMFLRDWIIQKFKTENTTTEVVSKSKFWTGFISFLNPVLWLKDIVSLFNVRKLVIYLLIIGTIFGYGWYRGKLNSPVNVNLGYGKEAYIRLNGETLHIAKDGNVYIEDTKTGEILKHIKAKDIKGLKMQLAPYGLQLKPFVLVGASGSMSGDTGIEAGAGVSFARIWKVNLDAFLTNRGAYIGSSYKLTDNSGIGIGLGKGWQKDEVRGIIYYKFEF